jgi:hypothetical protein
LLHAAEIEIPQQNVRLLASETLEEWRPCRSVRNTDKIAAHRVLLSRRSLTPVQGDVHEIGEAGDERVPLVSADVARRLHRPRLVLNRYLSLTWHLLHAVGGSYQEYSMCCLSRHMDTCSMCHSRCNGVLSSFDVGGLRSSSNGLAFRNQT